MLGWIIIILGLYKIIGNANFWAGLIIIVFGIFCLGKESDIEETKKESSIDRSKDILDEIGGYNNIDINHNYFSLPLIITKKELIIYINS